MLIYKNVIEHYLKDKFQDVDVVSIGDDGTLNIKNCSGSDEEKIAKDIISAFPRIKRICVTDRNGLGLNKCRPA